MEMQETNLMAELIMIKQCGMKPNFSELAKKYGKDRHVVEGAAVHADDAFVETNLLDIGFRVAKDWLEPFVLAIEGHRGMHRIPDLGALVPLRDVAGILP